MVDAHDRDAAIDSLARAIDETEVGGVQTTLPFHRAGAASEAFRRAELSTGWVVANWDGEAVRADAVRRALLAVGLAAIAGTMSPPAPASMPPAATLAGAGTGGPADRQTRSPWHQSGRAGGVDRWPM